MGAARPAINTPFVPFHLPDKKGPKWSWGVGLEGRLFVRSERRARALTLPWNSAVRTLAQENPQKRAVHRFKVITARVWKGSDLFRAVSRRVTFGLFLARSFFSACQTRGALWGTVLDPEDHKPPRSHRKGFLHLEEKQKKRINVSSSRQVWLTPE